MITPSADKQIESLKNQIENMMTTTPRQGQKAYWYTLDIANTKTQKANNKLAEAKKEIAALKSTIRQKDKLLSMESTKLSELKQLAVKMEGNSADYAFLIEQYNSKPWYYRLFNKVK